MLPDCWKLAAITDIQLTFLTVGYRVKCSKIAYTDTLQPFLMPRETGPADFCLKSIGHDQYAIFLEKDT